MVVVRVWSSAASTIRTLTNTVSRQHVSLEVDTEYEPTNLHSVMKITISDMQTKHGSTWNGKRYYSLYV